MLSAETAAGTYPIESATAMNRIIVAVEQDSHYRKMLTASTQIPLATVSDAISSSLNPVTIILPLAVTFTYTESGFSSFRAARERPVAPVIGCTPNHRTARRLAIVWGVHAVVSERTSSVTQMVDHAHRITLHEGFGEYGDTIAITAGIPFGRAGTTNMLRLSQIKKPESDL